MIFVPDGRRRCILGAISYGFAGRELLRLLEVSTSLVYPRVVDFVAGGKRGVGRIAPGIAADGEVDQ